MTAPAAGVGASDRNQTTEPPAPQGLGIDESARQSSREAATRLRPRLRRGKQRKAPKGRQRLAWGVSPRFPWPLSPTSPEGAAESSRQLPGSGSGSMANGWEGGDSEFRIQNSEFKSAFICVFCRLSLDSDTASDSDSNIQHPRSGWMGARFSLRPLCVPWRAFAARPPAVDRAPWA